MKTKVLFRATVDCEVVVDVPGSNWCYGEGIFEDAVKEVITSNKRLVPCMEEDDFPKITIDDWMEA